MSRSYYTEDQKMVQTNFPKWTFEECSLIQNILFEKGYFVNTVSRVGADRKSHDALQVEREDVPQLVEQLFRQRLVAEFQAEGSYKASICFVYDYAAETIISAVRQFQKNRNNGGIL